MDKQTKELTLEGVWILDSPNIFYLCNDSSIYAEIRNNSNHPIKINTVTYSFQVDTHLPTCKEKTHHHVTIKPYHMSTLNIPLKIGLTLSGYTNRVTIVAEYTVGQSAPRKIVLEGATCYAVINNIPLRHNKYFFVSHKAPENMEITNQLVCYLNKIGFDGYVAEQDLKPGYDLWSEKIFPAIDACHGLIVLWTAEAMKNPNNMHKEVKYAQRKNKKIIEIIEKNTWSEETSSKTVEHILIDGKISKINIANLATTIYNLYRRGDFMKNPYTVSAIRIVISSE